MTNTVQPIESTDLLPCLVPAPPIGGESLFLAWDQTSQRPIWHEASDTDLFLATDGWQLGNKNDIFLRADGWTNMKFSPPRTKLEVIQQSAIDMTIYVGSNPWDGYINGASFSDTLKIVGENPTSNVHIHIDMPAELKTNTHMMVMYSGPYYDYDSSDDEMDAYFNGLSVDDYGFVTNFSIDIFDILPQFVADAYYNGTISSNLPGLDSLPSSYIINVTIEGDNFDTVTITHNLNVDLQFWG